MRNLLQKSIYGFLAIVFVFANLLRVHAEGSRDLFPKSAKGDRAYLLSSTTEGNFNPFATPGTVKVYVKAGETVYLGSSVIDKRWPSTTGVYPKIIIRTPNGKKYELAGDAQTTGLIQNRTQELNGPNRSGVTNGYNPLKKVQMQKIGRLRKLYPVKGQVIL